MSLIRKGVRVLKRLFVASTTAPLFLSIQSTLPGKRKLPDYDLSFCDKRALDYETRARGIRISSEMASQFDVGLSQILSSDPHEQRRASSTFQKLTRTPLRDTATLHVNLSAANTLAGRPNRGLEAINRAERNLVGLPDSIRAQYSQIITDNRAEIERLKKVTK